MTKEIESTPQAVHGPDDSLVVDMAIIPEHVHTMFGGVCPHCESEQEAEMVTYIHETEELKTMMVFMGDIMKCVDCNGLHMVVEFPKIDYDDVIMTRWTIPDKYRAGM